MFKQRSQVFAADERAAHRIRLQVGVYEFRKKHFPPDSPLQHLDLYSFSLLMHLENQSDLATWYQWLLTAHTTPLDQKTKRRRIRSRTIRTYFAKAVRTLHELKCVERWRHAYWPHGYEFRLLPHGRNLAAQALGGPPPDPP